MDPLKELREARRGRETACGQSIGLAAEPAPLVPVVE
jgi:hypothetical protein